MIQKYRYKVIKPNTRIALNFYYSLEELENGAWLEDKKKFNIDDAFIYKDQSIGNFDTNENEFFTNDIIRFNNASKYVKKEYWNPEYIILQGKTKIKLKYIGTYFDIGNAYFNFENYPENFEILGNVHENLKYFKP